MVIAALASALAYGTLIAYGIFWLKDKLSEETEEYEGVPDGRIRPNYGGDNDLNNEEQRQMDLGVGAIEATTSYQGEVNLW